MENILTIDDVSKKLQMSKSTIYKYAEKNSIPSFKIGTCLRFFENEIDDYINAIKEQRKNAR
jgi:excisionase family DNA binding protein